MSKKGDGKIIDITKNDRFFKQNALKFYARGSDFVILYADVLFVINFSMDFLALFLTSYLMHRRVHKFRIILASSIGAIYSILEMVLQLNSIISVLLTIITSILLCLVGFKEKKIKHFIGMLLVFWGISATIGGIMSLLYTFLNKVLQEYILDLKIEEAQLYNGARFFIIASISVIAAIIFGKIFSAKSSVIEVDLQVKINNKIYKLRGLCDSGNILTEPITGKRVILVSDKSEIGRVINSFPEHKKRYIPYNTIDGGGLIRGITPQEIHIKDKEVIAIIATVNKEDFNGLEALVPGSMV